MYPPWPVPGTHRGWYVPGTHRGRYQVLTVTGMYQELTVAGMYVPGILTVAGAPPRSDGSGVCLCRYPIDVMGATAALHSPMIGGMEGTYPTHATGSGPLAATPGQFVSGRFERRAARLAPAATLDCSHTREDRSA